MSSDLPQTPHRSLTRDAHLSKAGKHLFGSAYKDALRMVLSLSWICPKIQQTTVIQRWTLNLVSRDSVGDGAHVQGH